MNRRVAGGLLLVGSPGFAASTLVLSAAAVESAVGHTPLWAAGLISFCTWGAATFGTAAGAYLVARRPEDRPLPVVAAGGGGMAVFLACVYVADKVLKWI